MTSKRTNQDEQEDALSYIFGISAHGALRASLMQQSPLLLLGEAGVGKTHLITVILKQLYRHNRNMQVAFLDEIGQIAFQFARREQTAIAVRHDAVFHSGVFLHHLIREMQERARLKAGTGGEHVYRLLVIDEFLWMRRDEQQFLQPLRKILSLLQEETTLKNQYGLIVSSQLGDPETNRRFPHQFLFRSPDYPGLDTTDALASQALEQGQFFTRPENMLCQIPEISSHV